MTPEELSRAFPLNILEEALKIKQAGGNLVSKEGGESGNSS